MEEDTLTPSFRYKYIGPECDQFNEGELYLCSGRNSFVGNEGIDYAFADEVNLKDLFDIESGV